MTSFLQIYFNVQKFKAQLILLSFVFMTLAACNPISKTKLGDEVFSNVAISMRNSTLIVSNPQVAVGSSVSVTLSLKDDGNVAYISTRPKVSFSASGGESAGTLSSVTNNGDGSYSATFTGVTSGSATTLHATVNGEELISTLPTLQVTLDNYDLANSSVTVSADSVASSSNVIATLTVRDISNTQLSSGGLTLLFSNTGGSSTGTLVQ